MLRLEVQYTWSTSGLGVQHEGCTLRLGVRQKASTLRLSVHRTRSRDVCVKFSHHPQMCTSHAILGLFRVLHVGTILGCLFHTIHNHWGVLFTRHTATGVSELNDTQPLGCLIYTTHSHWGVCFTRRTAAGVSASHDTQPLVCLLYTIQNRRGVCFTRHTTAGVFVLHDTEPQKGVCFTRHTAVGVSALHDTQPLRCLLYTTHNRWGVCFTRYRTAWVSVLHNTLSVSISHDAQAQNCILPAIRICFHAHLTKSTPDYSDRVHKPFSVHTTNQVYKRLSLHHTRSTDA